MYSIQLQQDSTLSYDGMSCNKTLPVSSVARATRLNQSSANLRTRDIFLMKKKQDLFLSYL